MLELDLAVDVSGEAVEVVALQQHVVEFQEGQALLHSLLKALGPQHVVDGEVSADVSHEFQVVDVAQPIRVVDADSLAGRGLLVLAALAQDAFALHVLPVLIELQELVEQSLEGSAVLVDLLRGHHGTGVGAAGGVAQHGGAAADEDHRGVAVLLHVHHDDDLHKVAYVQAVRRGVEADVELHLLLAQQVADAFVIRGLFDKAALFQHVVYVVEFAYVVGNLKHGKIVSLICFI